MSDNEQNKTDEQESAKDRLPTVSDATKKLLEQNGKTFQGRGAEKKG